MTTATSQLATEIRNSGLSRQAWFEQAIESNDDVIEQGDLVFFTVDNGSQYRIGHINDIFDDVILPQNDNGLFFIDRWIAEETTSLIEKAETQIEFSGIFGKLVSLVAAIVA